MIVQSQSSLVLGQTVGGSHGPLDKYGGDHVEYTNSDGKENDLDSRVSWDGDTYKYYANVAKYSSPTTNIKKRNEFNTPTCYSY